MTTQQDAAPVDRGGEGGQPASPPGRSRWSARRLVGLLRHEWTLVVLGGLLLAVALTWPTMRHPASTIPQDIGDPLLQTWQIAWGGHALFTDPVNLWHSNTFYPEQYSYAFSDTLLGYAPIGALGSGPVAAVVHYNILYVLVHALAFIGAYALVRQLGAGRIGAVAAGLAFGYAPWKLAQAGHLHVLSSGGIPLALAMLARGHGWSLRHGYRPDRRRPGWALAGWLVAAWQMTLGFGIGLPFAYVLALICLIVVVRYCWAWRRGRPVFGRRLLTADVAGGLAFGAVSLFMAWPYLQVVAQHPGGRRSLEHVALFSPPLRGFFTAPAQSWLWGERHAAVRDTLTVSGEMTLLPGLMLICLAVTGLFFSVWRIRHRVALAIGVVVSVALAQGTEFGDGGYPGYALLVDYLPGWDGIRTSGRLVLWTTLLLGVLAAGALTFLVESVAAPAGVGQGRRVAWVRAGNLLVRLAALAPLTLMLAESVNVTPHVPVPAEPAAMRNVTGPVLVLPSEGLFEFQVMLWSTDGFPRIVNGLTSFAVPSQEEIRAGTASFPDDFSVDYLRRMGIRTVVVFPEEAAGTRWQDVPFRSASGLDVRREEVDGAIVFHLD